MAKVLGVIGARLNSSRLPAKHLLELAGKPLIARIFERLEVIAEIDRLVLATTDDAYNQPLVEWAQNNDKKVFAYNGDVNDLVGRVDAIVQKEQPDILIYFCGDSPLIEPTTVSSLINGLLGDPNTELIELESPMQDNKYIHEGFSVYRRKVWDRIVEEASLPEEREHVGVSLRHFSDTLTKEAISEDPIFASVSHRISVDTPSDYRFMSEIYQRWYAKNNASTIVSLKWVIEEIRKDKALAEINSNVLQKAVGDTSISTLIVCQVGAEIGLGHLSRTLTVARALQDRVFSGIRILIQGEPIQRSDLALIPHHYISASEDISSAVLHEVNIKRTDVVIFDIQAQRLPKDLSGLLEQLRVQHTHVVAIDGLFEYCNQLDFIHIPGFYIDPAKTSHCHQPIYFGWEYYLLSKPAHSRMWSKGNKLLVLTGGSDVTKLGQTLPNELESKLPEGTEVHWVKGPFAGKPKLPVMPRLQWTIHEAPSDLSKLMTQVNYALTVYGVSFFELLQHGVPTVVFSPYGDRDNIELDKLRSETIAVVAKDRYSAIDALNKLMCDHEMAQTISRHAATKIDGQGACRLAERIRMVVSR